MLSLTRCRTRLSGRQTARTRWRSSPEQTRALAGPTSISRLLGGGFGGRNDRDGKDEVQVHITNTSNLPVEAIEMEYPLLVEAYGLIEDSGGAGTWRGGLGLRRVVTPVDHDCVFTGIGERFRYQPWGIFGGKPGGSGRFAVQTRDGAIKDMPTKFGDAPLREGDRAIVETPGSGGYGPPEGRPAATLAEDWDSGKFTARYMREYYDWAPPSSD
ncbi:MAG: hydantoinase B/oxoprolinase family protein [Thalassobaculum sp.]